jgi:hypothetical protein
VQAAAAGLRILHRSPQQQEAGPLAQGEATQPNIDRPNPTQRDWLPLRLDRSQLHAPRRGPPTLDWHAARRSPLVAASIQLDPNRGDDQREEQ